MLEILTKPIVIGSISIPFVIILTIIVVVISISILSFFYIVESKKSDVKSSTESKKNVKEDTKKEEGYKRDIDKLKRSIPYLSKKEASNRFIKIIRSFFKDVSELDYEFTFEELADEFREKGRHKGLILFSEKVSDLKYKKGDISKKDLLTLCKEFEAILNYEAIPEVEKINKKSIFKRLRKSSVPHVGEPPLNDKQQDSKQS